MCVIYFTWPLAIYPLNRDGMRMTDRLTNPLVFHWWIGLDWIGLCHIPVCTCMHPPSLDPILLVGPLDGQACVML